MSSLKSLSYRIETLALLGAYSPHILRGSYIHAEVSRLLSVPIHNVSNPAIQRCQRSCRLAKGSTDWCMWLTFEIWLKTECLTTNWLSAKSCEMHWVKNCCSQGVDKSGAILNTQLFSETNYIIITHPSEPAGIFIPRTVRTEILSKIVRPATKTCLQIYYHFSCMLIRLLGRKVMVNWHKK